MGVLKKNVFLVGFMGVGKTTVARRMARDMGVACVDVDAYLERKHGKSAAELFGEHGEQKLRELEYEALSECADMGPAVISCGEGIVAYPKSRALLKRRGFAVMLESSEATSLGRIHNLSTRPLLAHDCDIEGLWEQRKPLYEDVARAKINVQGRSTGSVAGFVAKVLARAGVYEPEAEDAVAEKIKADVQKRRKKHHRPKSGRPRSAAERGGVPRKGGKSADGRKAGGGKGQGPKAAGSKPTGVDKHPSRGSQASHSPDGENAASHHARRRRRRGKKHVATGGGAPSQGHAPHGAATKRPNA